MKTLARKPKVRATKAFASVTLGLLAAPFLFVPTVSAASVAWAGVLTRVHVMANGAVLVNTSGNREGTTPSCGTGQPTRFALDSTTAAGKSQLAGILAAFAAGKNVVIVGNGTNCSAFGDSETIEYFYIES